MHVGEHRITKDSLRKLVDEELARRGRSVSTELYEHALKYEFIADERGHLDNEQLAPRIVGLIEWAQTAPISSEFSPHWFKPEGGYPLLKPPTWWQVTIEQRFSAFADLRLDVLAHLGIEPVPTSFDDEAASAAWTRLKRLKAEQSSVGDELHLPMKLGVDPETGWPNLQDIVFRRGAHRTGSEHRQPNRPQPSPHENSVAFLYDAMAHVARCIGCAEDQALAFLLWGEVPHISWISVTPVSTRGALQILVRHPQVPARDVSAAYRAVRDTLWGPRRRGNKERQLRLAEIVETLLARDGSIDWNEVERQLENYGFRYKNRRSLTQSWRNYSKARATEFAVRGPRSEEKPAGNPDASDG